VSAIDQELGPEIQAQHGAHRLSVSPRAPLDPQPPHRRSPTKHSERSDDYYDQVIRLINAVHEIGSGSHVVDWPKAKMFVSVSSLD
jgi:hypothetical protein